LPPFGCVDASLSAPTIDGWSEQWYVFETFASDTGADDAPGAMFPVSTPSSGMTIRCVMESPFFHTTVWPVVHIAGLGANDWSPLLPAIMMVVTLEEPVGEGVVGGVDELFPP
jgi:hypothetical protein